MRIRTVKPDFFKDDKLCELPPLTRLLFEGLWCMSDRDGRLEDRSKYIKIEILPYDKCNVDEMLQSLHDNGFIHRYEVEGLRYIQVINFKKHQRITGKEAEIPSVFPCIPSGKSIEKQRGNNGESMDASQMSRKGRERKGREKEGKGVVAASGQLPTQEEFLTSLRENIAYKHIDLDREFAKMDEWLRLPRNKHRKKTRQFVLNWLNRIDPPLEGKHARSEFERRTDGLREFLADNAGGVQSGNDPPPGLFPEHATRQRAGPGNVRGPEGSDSG